jgi:hypothetical protein
MEIHLHMPEEKSGDGTSRLRSLFRRRKASGTAKGLHRFHGLRREQRGSALPQCLTTRQASLALRTVQLLPLKGLSTLGSGPARFQTEPPACYRAPWRLPGPDFHRQATTSFRSGHDRWTITS